MPTPIRLPAISADFEAGTLTDWRKAVGESVRKGDVLCEIESDKAVVTVEADSVGVLGAIRIPAGSRDVPVNTVLGFLLQAGETEADIPGADVTASQSSPMGRQDAAKSASQPPERAPSGPPGRIYASPVARRIAAQRGIDLAGVKGRGPNGRILKTDVEAQVEATAPVEAAAPAAETAIQAAFDRSQPQVPVSSGRSELPNSTLRKVIAQRLTAAKRDIPHFYLSVDCRLDALVPFRQQLNEHFTRSGIRISINDCIIKAAALALVDVPDANASWSEDAIYRYDTVDISVAVATPRGLIAPIVRDANAKSLADLSREMRKLAARAVAGELKADEYKGGGFSLSNLGMYGIKSFSAIINPPQSCILAVGAAERRPVVQGDRIDIGTVMSCTLSVDHRSVDGAVGAQFLTAFKRYMEHPALLLLSNGY